MNKNKRLVQTKPDGVFKGSQHRLSKQRDLRKLIIKEAKSNTTQKTKNIKKERKETRKQILQILGSLLQNTQTDWKEKIVICGLIL